MDIQVTNVHTVNNITEARQQIQYYKLKGYDKEHLYILAHDKDRTKRIAEEMNVEQIGVAEEGLDTAIANIFRSRGSELRAKLKSMGISPEEADRLEKEMDHDKIVVIAWGGNQFNGDEYDPAVVYYPLILV